MTHRPLFLALAACTAAAVSSAAGASTAKQQFTITSTTAAVGKNSPTRVLADGAINGRGTVDVKSSHDTRIDHMTSTSGRGPSFSSPSRSRTPSTRSRRSPRHRPRPRTFTITGGTGNFRGAHGSGTYLATASSTAPGTQPAPASGAALRSRKPPPEST